MIKIIPEYGVNAVTLRYECKGVTELSHVWYDPYGNELGTDDTVTVYENGIYSIEYPSFNAKYHFDAASSQVAIKRISEQYCGGEDPVSFYDWLIALDKND